MTAGAALLLCLWMWNRQLDLRPVYVAVPLKEGAACEAEFVARHTGTYEVELELREPASAEVFTRYITVTDQPGALDAVWTVDAAGEPLAQGDSRGFLYSSGYSLRRRIVTQALGLDSYDDIRKDRHSRGVGRFEATAGQQIRFSVMLGSDPEAELSSGKPHFALRFNRRSRTMQLRRALAAAAGAATLFAAGLVWMLWSVLRAPASPRR